MKQEYNNAEPQERTDPILGNFLNEMRYILGLKIDYRNDSASMCKKVTSKVREILEINDDLNRKVRDLEEDLKISNQTVNKFENQVALLEDKCLSAESKGNFIESRNKSQLSELEESNFKAKNKLSSLYQAIGIFSETQIKTVEQAKTALSKMDKERMDFKNQYLSVLETQSKVAADSSADSRKKIKAVTDLKDKNAELLAENKKLK